jgi:hypothetical protein
VIFVVYRKIGKNRKDAKKPNKTTREPLHHQEAKADSVYTVQWYEGE